MYSQDYLFVFFFQEIAKEYGDKLILLKVDVDEQEVGYLKYGISTFCRFM